MTAEHKDRIIRLYSRGLHEKFNTPQFLDNIKEVYEVGNFLKASGIMDAVIDFNQAFLGNMTSPRNEIGFSGSTAGGVLTKAAKAGIV